MKTCFIQTILLLLITGIAFGQENIPLGAWRLHLSFNKLGDLVNADNAIFAASENGVITLDKLDSEVSTITKIDGLSGGRISALGYDEKRKILIVGFDDGLVNFISDAEIIVLDRINSSTTISGSKKINHILVIEDLGYLATDFGVVILDLAKLELRETYRDLGENGDLLEIFEVVSFQDSLFLATAQGVISGSLSENSNLLDFRNWKRYNQGDLDDEIKSITLYNNQLYAAIDNQGIYRLIGGSWSKESFFQGSVYNSIAGSSNHLLIAIPGAIHLVNELGSSSVLPSSEFANPMAVSEDANGRLWIADEVNGLVSFSAGAYSFFTPSGPSGNEPWRLRVNANTIVNMRGGYIDTSTPQLREATISKFTNGLWENVKVTLGRDITDFSTFGEISYYASYGYGLEGVSTGGSSMVYNESNSPLVNSNSPEAAVLIPSIQSGADGLWVANYNSASPLHFLKPDLTWESFSFAQSQTQYPIELLVDRVGQVWMIVDPARGGGIFVFDKNSGKSVYLSNQAGSGGLPSNTVLSITNDREGQVWIGTNEGVVYFPNPQSIFNVSIDAVRPIYENRFLLRDESINALAVDGGNRKWIGTNNGVWLFNPTGEELIYNFTEESTPLLDDVVRGIACEPTSGEVFFATNKGLVSFRSDATGSTRSFENVKIFPNPVTREFNGLVAISGLYRDAIVKITDISGRLVWQTIANGGTASWNGRQLNGDRMNTGMYLVFATSENGTERHVGKIAVIE